MSRDIELGCRCGAIHGWARDVSPSKSNRVICYCDDCQAYLHHLGRADLLDAHGGTEVVHVAPSAVTFDRGQERIACVRLGPKGLYRWYASCCKTPLGNTLSPSVPFIGLQMEALRGAPDAARRDEAFGKSRGAAWPQFATGGRPQGSTRFPLRMIMHTAGLIVGWKISGRAWPHPFFDRVTRKPVLPSTTLTPPEREALRAYCGPHPHAPAPTR